MTDAQVHDFQKRVRGISRQHRRLSQGYVQLVERDGLLVPTRRQMRRGFPIKGLMITLIGFMVFKAFLFSQVGAVNYTDRVQTLAKGSTIEQAGAWIMQDDPVTIAIAELITNPF
ncbi:hypothetical protein MUY35_10665 [Aliiroseovarius sp. S1339]|uniref:hypothetical protein n=1 Tax=Aliiroseovarius sp. S1339 TaxID=2936990 RepID=UPI0020BDA14F|nr:hypothetical protein [Aliiroseovarius sp. S1339]MCK8464313.1 hypothetical protein [Aliiroseovarius sp. S1339]